MGITVKLSGFDRHADRYEAVWESDPVARAMREVVHDVLLEVLPPGGRVLDVGCGVGEDAAWLASQGFEVVAVDASAGMVRATRARGIEAHQLRAEELAELARQGPFDGALFDFGVLNVVGLEAAGAGLAVCLRPGAPVVAVPMPRVHPSWTLAHLLRGRPGQALSRLLPQVDVDVEGQVVPTRYLGARELRRAWGHAFEVVDQQGLGFLLPPPGSRRPEGLVERMASLEAPLRRLPGLRSIGDHVIVVLERRGAPAPVHAPGGRNALRDRLRRRQSPAFDGEVDLRLLVLELTRGCQSRCQSCDFRGPAGGEALDLEVIEGLLDEAVARGTREVLLTGGEPLLRRDLPEILEACRRRGLHTVLLSNGLALARHAAMVAAGAHRVVLSLDGWDRESYHRIRGVDGLPALRRGLLALRAHAPELPVGARITVSGLNAGHLGAIARLAWELGLDSVSYLAADLEGTDAFARQEAAGLPLPDWRELRAELADLRLAWPRPFLVDGDAALDRIWQHFAAHAGDLPARPPRCNAPFRSAVVGADLALKPCFFLPPAGSVADGLDAGLRTTGETLRHLDVATNPTCARCVCWAWIA